jgi:TRAP transporter TAXI family solute receptor
MDDSDIQRLVDDHPAFWKTGIPAKAYASQPKETITFATRGILVASADLDEETVYELIGAIHDNQKKMTRAHPALSSFTVTREHENDLGIKLHPGAAKYFSEHGS